MTLPRCIECDEPTENPENDYAEHVCDSCEEAANERAYERWVGSYYGGSVVSLREQQARAHRFK